MLYKQEILKHVCREKLNKSNVKLKTVMAFLKHKCKWTSSEGSPKLIGWGLETSHTPTHTQSLSRSGTIPVSIVISFTKNVHFQKYTKNWKVDNSMTYTSGALSLLKLISRAYSGRGGGVLNVRITIIIAVSWTSLHRR